VTARRNQLVILLLFFGLIGIFSGVAIWLMSQSQQKERDLLQVQSELEQTKQKMQILNEQNVAALTNRSKLQKDVTTLKKQLDLISKENVSLRLAVKDSQTRFSALATDNSSLKVRLAATEQQLALKQSLKPAAAPPAAAPTIFAPASPVPAKR
jgi:septal ring factor EnvC (AmiA/AmiB activator)